MSRDNADLPPESLAEMLARHGRSSQRDAACLAGIAFLAGLALGLAL